MDGSVATMLLRRSRSRSRVATHSLTHTPTHSHTAHPCIVFCSSLVILGNSVVLCYYVTDGKCFINGRSVSLSLFVDIFSFWLKIFRYHHDGNRTHHGIRCRRVGKYHARNCFPGTGRAFDCHLYHPSTIYQSVQWIRSSHDSQ